MLEATNMVLAIPEPMTCWDEVRRRYPDQWVTLVEVDWIPDVPFDFRSALAIGHGQRRRDAMAQARPLLEKYNRHGCFFTGTIRAPRRLYLEP